jgi:sugar phosphate isomerase/epimerase
MFEFPTFVNKQTIKLMIMMNTGIKIENYLEDKGIITELLNYFKHNRQYLLELGFYHKPNALHELFSEYCKNEFKRIVTHNRHRNSVISLYRGTQKLLKELYFSKQLNSQYSIIHLTESKAEEDLFTEPELLFKGFPQLEKLNNIASQYNYHYYLENTYHGISFYKELFGLVKRKDLDRIHFCFDIGHAKVWSANTLREWVDFLEFLKFNDIRIHFHLHLNSGTKDEHLSFMECNHTGGDNFSDYVRYEDVFRDLIFRFPEERKIFEVKPKFAVPNIQFINRLLSKEKLVS